MLNYNNPARRLYEFLQLGRSMRIDVQCRTAFSEILQISDPSELWSAIGELSRLVRKTQDAIAQYYPGYAPASYWSDKVDAAFLNMHPSGVWQSFIGSIDDHTMHYLGMCVQLLDAKLPHTKLDDQERANYRAELNDLLEEVLESNDAPELKEYMRASLERIIKALDQYKITGDLGVLTAVQTAFGEVLLDPDMQAQAKDSSIAKKVFKAMGDGAKGFVVTKEVVEAIKFVVDLLN